MQGGGVACRTCGEHSCLREVGDRFRLGGLLERGKCIKPETGSGWKKERHLG